MSDFSKKYGQGFNFKVTDFEADENTNMEIRTIEVGGFMPMFLALRLPFGKAPRVKGASDFFTEGETVNYGGLVTPHPKDIQLLQTLIKNGDEHAKVMRGVVVWARITAPVYWWSELETYRAGHERLCSESTMHIDCKGLQGEELQKAKSEIPMGKELTKIDMFSYQCLRNICRQRANHRLPEWHQFIDWVHTLPLAEELIFVGL